MSRARRRIFGLLLLLCLPAGSVKAGVGSWTSAGPPGVDVSAMAVEPKASTVYLGTKSGSIFTSSDKGGTWEKVYAGPANTAIASIAVAGEALYAAVEVPYCATVTGPGVIRSEDGGRTWWSAGLDTQSVTFLAVDPSHPSTIFAVTARALNRSPDGGSTWQEIFHSDGNRSVRDVAIDPTDPSILLSGTTVGGYKSTDGGMTFRSVNRPVDCFHNPSTCDNSLTSLPGGMAGPFLFDPSSPGTVYGHTPLGDYRSRDHGDTWLACGPPYGLLTLDSSQPGRLYGISSTGVVTIADSGNWTPAGGTPPAEFGDGITALACDARIPLRLYVGTHWAPFRSDDGGKTWIPLSATIRDLPVSAFAFDPSDPLTAYAAQSRRGIFKTTDGGAHWAPSGYANSATTIETLAVDPFDPATLLSLVSDRDEPGAIRHPLRSTDGGATWTRAGEIPIYFPTTPPVPRVLLPDPTSSASWYLGSYNHVDITRDGGLSWQPIALNLSGLIPRVYALAADRRTPGLVYAAGFGGLFRSDNHGNSWRLLNGNLLNVSGLAVDPKDSALYVATPDGLLNLSGSVLWDPKRDPSAGTPISVSVDPSSAAIYVATRTRVLRSWDSGANWQSLSDGLPPNLVSGVTVHPKDGRLAVLTQAGLYVRENCEDAATLCLAGRFLVRSRWTTPDGQSGDGMAVPLSTDAGYFWFFSPNNVETIVKMVAGCSVNSRVWIFAAGLTDVEVVFTVTDRVTGTVRTYVNPQGTPFQPIQDTSAFASCPMTPASSSPSTLSSASSANAGATPCASDATTLCVNGGRFKIQARWTTPDGNGGTGQAVRLTSDTGYFWFFSPNSAELVAKVVSGCSVNSRYWMFAGGLTDVNVVLTVTDTQSGQVRTYINPQGTPFAPVLDAAAFATCP